MIKYGCTFLFRTYANKSFISNQIWWNSSLENTCKINKIHHYVESIMLLDSSSFSTKFPIHKLILYLFFNHHEKIKYVSWSTYKIAVWKRWIMHRERFEFKLYLLACLVPSSNIDSTSPRYIPNARYLVLIPL